jgi:hypothetical protein
MLNAIGQFSVREKRVDAAHDALTTASFSAFKLVFWLHPIATDHARLDRGQSYRFADEAR